VPSKGIIIANFDDENVRQLVQEHRVVKNSLVKYVSYGYEKECDYRIGKLEYSGNSMSFEIGNKDNENLKLTIISVSSDQRSFIFLYNGEMIRFSSNGNSISFLDRIPGITFAFNYEDDIALEELTLSKLEEIIPLADKAHTSIRGNDDLIFSSESFTAYFLTNKDVKFTASTYQDIEEKMLIHSRTISVAELSPTTFNLDLETGQFIEETK